MRHYHLPLGNKGPPLQRRPHRGVLDDVDPRTGSACPRGRGKRGTHLLRQARNASLPCEVCPPFATLGDWRAVRDSMLRNPFEKLKALSIFCDEAGQQDMSAGYYLITMVSHGQNAPIDIHVEDYQRRLAAHQLPDIPFHMNELVHGHGDYEGVDQFTRKGLLGHFNAFARRLPIQYQTFFYSSYTASSTVSPRASGVTPSSPQGASSLRADARRPRGVLQAGARGCHTVASR